jgi:hypothetical protein
MARTKQKTGSRSLAVYAFFLELYAQEFLAQHRAEMLQNFEDLENASSSKVALWLFIGKDLMFSLISRNVPKSLWGQTILMLITLGIVLAVLWALTSHHYFIGAVTVCYGFVIGWFAGWLAKRRQMSHQQNRSVRRKLHLKVGCHILSNPDHHPLN